MDSKCNNKTITFYYSTNMEKKTLAGLDVAEHGNDSTVLTIGYKEENKYIVTDIYDWNQKETMATAGMVADLLIKHDVESIVVDSNGIGAGVYSRLSELKREGKIKTMVRDYRGGRSPITKVGQTRFLNQKAEAYFNLRDLFEKRLIKIPNNKKLINDLVKMKWELNSTMKIRILDPGTSEGDTAEEKSPDFADSLCYFASSGGVPSLIFGSLHTK